MKREILFKAKRVDNGKWVEGWYIRSENELFARILQTRKQNDSFMEYTWNDVDEKTLCQYTGLCDRNGERIFEGDILKTMECRKTIPSGFVSFLNCEWTLLDEETCDNCPLIVISDYCEITGNIHDGDLQ